MSNTLKQNVEGALANVEIAQGKFSGGHPKEGQFALTTAKGQLTVALTQIPAPTPPPPAVPVPLGIPGTWKLIFDQEFVGQTALDTNIWDDGWWAGKTGGTSGPVNGAESAGYNSTHISFDEDGICLLLDETPVTTSKGTYGYTGALISSNPGGGATTGFQFTYGVAEARIYVPGDAAGQICNWPAFWQTTATQYPYNETDTLEVLSGSAWAHIHNNNGPANNDGLEAKTVITPGWHTFANEWDVTGVEFFYDGVSIGKIAAIASNQPQYLILNNTLNTAWAPTSVPSTLKCSYVRVWQAAV